MPYTFNFSKLISDLTGPKGLAALTEELHKIRNEVERLKNNVQPQAERRLKAIQVRLKGIRANWEKRQTKFEKEVEKSLGTVKRVAKDAEVKLQKAMRGQSSKGSKKKKAGRTIKKSAKSRSRKSS